MSTFDELTAKYAGLDAAEHEVKNARGRIVRWTGERLEIGHDRFFRPIDFEDFADLDSDIFRDLWYRALGNTERKKKAEEGYRKILMHMDFVNHLIRVDS